MLDMSNELTEKEIFDALASITSNKSPVNDGHTKEFHHTFWNKVRYIFMNFLRESKAKII